MHSAWTVEERAGPGSDRATMRPATQGPIGGTRAGSPGSITALRLVRMAAPALEQDEPGARGPALDLVRPLAAVAACRPGPRNRQPSPVDRRALALWPRLDRRTLTRCRGDAGRIARHVARRTNLPLETIVGMLDGT